MNYSRTDFVLEMEFLNGPRNGPQGMKSDEMYNWNEDCAYGNDPGSMVSVNRCRDTWCIRLQGLVMQFKSLELVVRMIGLVYQVRLSTVM